jgi:hypothetical protein
VHVNISSPQILNDSIEDKEEQVDVQVQ